MNRSLAILLLAGIAWTPAASQEDAGLAADGVAELNANLKRIAVALESLQIDQRVMLTLRRVELAERRNAPLESRLRSAREDVRVNKEEIGHFERMARQFERELEEAVRAGADPASIPQRSELEQIGEMIAMAQDRLAENERRVFEAEDDIGRSRKRIAILEEQLEELLTALGD